MLIKVCIYICTFNNNSQSNLILKNMTQFQTQLDYLEAVAKVACYEIDYQKKQQAEKVFVDFCRVINIKAIPSLLNKGSQTLIFVIIEYINKFLEQYNIDQVKLIFQTIESIFYSWYQSKSHSFIQKTSNQSFQGKKMVSKYVQNSICLLLSNCMKIFYLQQTNRTQIVNWIYSHQNTKYRLFLFKIFINNIATIDSKMGFLKFRSLSYNFQEQVVPYIAKCLIPFLYSVEQTIKVNELSAMQQHLNLKSQTNLENQFVQNQPSQSDILFSQIEFKFAELVFQVLHQVVFYNYHLTYTEYEQQASFQNCLICFPEQFTKNIVTQEFICSLCYIIDKLIDFLPTSKFLKIALQCLQKIFLTKLSYVTEQKKKQFVAESTKALCSLLNKQNLNPYILSKILVCNNKFINNIEISYLKQKVQLREHYQKWLKSLSQVVIYILKNADMNKQLNFDSQNSLIIESLQLYVKVVGSCCAICIYQLQDDSKRKKDREFLGHQVDIITQIVVNRLLIQQTQNFLVGNTIQIFKTNVNQIKQFCNSFIQPFKSLASLNYNLLFQRINNCINYALNTSNDNISIKFNTFILLTEIIERTYLQRSIVLQKASDDDIFILGQILCKTFKFLEFYKQNKSINTDNSYYQGDVILLDMSILIFIDKILTQFLSCLESIQNSISLKHKLFQNMLKTQNRMKDINQASQDFILFCVQTILSYLLIYCNNNNYKVVSEFIFQTINRILMKFKWGVRRQIFKNSKIYIKLSSFLGNVSTSSQIIEPLIQNQLQKSMKVFYKFQAIKWRKKLFKIMALLYFDDVLDDFKGNIRSILQNIKNQHILMIMLDIEGISDAIDTPTIYKCFLNQVDKYFNLQKLTNQLVNYCSNFTQIKLLKKNPKIKIIKQIIKMHKSILQNKGQRAGSNKNLSQIYKLIKSFMGYWIQFLKMCDSQEWLGVVKQIYQTTIQILKCDKINFYLIQRTSVNQYSTFMFSLLDNMIALSDNIQEYPKLCPQFYSLALNMARQIQDPIFFPYKTNQAANSMLDIIPEKYMTIILSIFQKGVKMLNQILVGNSSKQSLVEKNLDILKYCFSYINFKSKCRIQYKSDMKKIDYLIANINQTVNQLGLELVNYLMQEKSYAAYKRVTIIVVYECCQMFPSLIQRISNIQMTEIMINQLKQCFQFLRSQEQEQFIQHFKAWLRMFHMTEAEIRSKQKQVFCESSYLFGSII